MNVRTDLKAGDLMQDLGNGLQSASAYLANLISEADAQATKLTNNAISFTSDVVDCVNSKRSSK